MIQQLIRFLPIAEKVIARKTTLPILTHVCVRDGHISATDLENTVRMKIDDTRYYTIPINILKTVLKTKPKHLEIDVLEDEKVQIQYDSRKLTFKSRDAEGFPSTPTDKFKSLGGWSLDMIRKLYSQLPYTSNDELKPALTGVYFEQNGALKSCATDGHLLRVINNVNLDGKSKLKNKATGIIPKKALQILARTVKGQVKAAVSKTHLRIMLGHELEFYVRLITEKYPDFDSVIPTEFQGSVLLEKAKFSELVKDGKPFVNRETKLGAFAIGESSVNVSIEDPEKDYTWDSKVPVIERQGKDIEIGLNLSLLEQILKSIDEQEVKWEYVSPISASILTGVNGQEANTLQLIMPIRLEKKDGK